MPWIHSTVSKQAHESAAFVSCVANCYNSKNFWNISLFIEEPFHF